MTVHGLSRDRLEDMLYEASAGYGFNVKWKRSPEYAGGDRDGREKWRCTLSVEDSSGPGARRSVSGRRVAAACWHVYGDFIDAVLRAGGTVETTVGRRTVHITREGDNWTDWNAGSEARPLYMSEACECERRGG